MTSERTIECAPNGPALPHELALAAELGLSDAPGRTPWAAFETGTVGTPCAFVTLCHWQAGMDQVQVLDPAALALDDEESRALLATAAPWFAEDGIALTPYRASVWLAQGGLLRDLVTISLDRVIGRAVSRELLRSDGAGSAVLARLQHEMQMLMYDHPVTDARMQRRQLYPNAIWISGAGMLPQPVPPQPALRIEASLRGPVLQDDPDAFAAAWQALDAQVLAGLATLAQPLRLTLAGERRAVTFSFEHAGGWVARFKQRWLGARASPQSILGTL